MIITENLCKLVLHFSRRKLGGLGLQVFLAIMLPVISSIGAIVWSTTSQFLITPGNIFKCVFFLTKKNTCFLLKKSNNTIVAT